MKLYATLFACWAIGALLVIAPYAARLYAVVEATS